LKRFAIARSSKQGYSAQYSQLSTPGKPLPEHPCDRFTLLIEPSDRIMADELRLSQMLVHLLSNAFKFTETDCKIGLRE